MDAPVRYDGTINGLNWAEREVMTMLNPDALAAHDASFTHPPFTTAIVCGWREASYPWEAMIRRALIEHQVDVVIHGAARGIDTRAGDVAAAMGLTVIPIPAHWEEHGRSAGPIRNHEMLRMLCLAAYAHPVGVIAFHPAIDESKGTAHMLRIAREAGISTRLITSPEAV